MFWAVFQGCSGAVLVVFWGDSPRILPEQPQNTPGTIPRTPPKHSQNTPPKPQVSVPGEHIGVSVLGVHIWRDPSRKMALSELERPF